MSFVWPLMLLGLLAVPIVIGLHVWNLRRRRRVAVRIPSAAIVRAAVPRRQMWKRHVPVALLAAALGVLAISAARPTAAVPVPVNTTSMILALDTSGSMCSTDVDPNRLTVAKEAAQRFVSEQPEGSRIGLVAFNGIAAVVVPPTTDTEALQKAISDLTVGMGTAIGQAILTSVDAIAEVNDNVLPTSVEVGSGASGDTGGGGEASTTDDGYEPDIVVVLTDGKSTRGIDPLDAAGLAADRQVRVYTIGFGTTEPAELVCSADQLAGGVFGFGGQGGQFGQGQGQFGQGQGGFGPGGGNAGFLDIDEPTLQQIAEMTGGQYFAAQDADQLVDVFSQLPSRVEIQTEDVDLSVVFVIAGLLLLGGAVVLSLRWNRAA